MYESTFEILVLIWIVLALIIMPIAVKQRAPYGRHTREGWGKMIDNKWAWIIMELPALVVLPIWLIISNRVLSWPALIMVGFYLCHYINRVLIFPFRLRTKGKKMPISIAVMAFIFNLVNGSVLGYHFGYGHVYIQSWMSDPRFLFGGIIFILGAYANNRSDYILINLRKPGESGYKIPKGFLFKYISCPNHFGEIVEWIGFAIMTWSLAGFSFAVWTAANLIPRALNHHGWYQATFLDYPERRKAVIPSIL